MLTDARITYALVNLFQLFETDFRGKPGGRYCLTREQFKAAFDVPRVHADDVRRIQDAAMKSFNLVIIDLDDLFVVTELGVMRNYRRPTSEVFDRVFNSED